MANEMLVQTSRLALPQKQPGAHLEAAGENSKPDRKADNENADVQALGKEQVVKLFLATKQRLDARERDISRMQADNENQLKWLRKMKENFDKAQASVEQHQQRELSLLKENQKLSQEFNSVQQNLRQEKRDNTKLKSEIDSLKRNLESKEKSLKEETDKLRKCLKELDQKQQNNEEQIKVIADQQSKNFRIKNSLKETKETLEVTNKGLEEKEQEILNLKTTVSEVVEERDKSNCKLRRAEEISKNLTGKLVSERAWIAKLVSSFVAVKTELDKVHMKRVYGYFKGVSSQTYVSGQNASEKAFDASQYLINRKLNEARFMPTVGQDQLPEQLVRMKGELINPKALERLRKIGTGSYGEVYMAVLKESIVALKELHGIVRNKTSRDVLIEDVRSVCRINHPNLLRTVGVCTLQGKVILVSEYMKMNLHEAIHVYDSDTLTDDDQLDIIRQICFGVECLHSGNVAHCNLKTTNVLMKHTSNGYTVKIADFDLCLLRDVESEVDDRHQRAVADDRHQRAVVDDRHQRAVVDDRHPRSVKINTFSAPEIMRGETLSVVEMMKADIYSLSLIVYDVVFQEEPLQTLPFSSKKLLDIQFRWLQELRYRSTENDWQRMVLNMTLNVCSANALERPSIAEYMHDLSIISMKAANSSRALLSSSVI